MAQRQVTVIWNETETLEVYGDYSKARPMSRDRIDPPEDARFEIDKVMFEGVDVTNLFKDEQYEELEEKVLTLID